MERNKIILIAAVCIAVPALACLFVYKHHSKSPTVPTTNTVQPLQQSLVKEVEDETVKEKSEKQLEELTEKPTIQLDQGDKFELEKEATNLQTDFLREHESFFPGETKDEITTLSEVIEYSDDDLFAENEEIIEIPPEEITAKKTAPENTKSPSNTIKSEPKKIVETQVVQEDANSGKISDKESKQKKQKTEEEDDLDDEDDDENDFSTDFDEDDDEDNED